MSVLLSRRALTCVLLVGLSVPRATAEPLVKPDRAPATWIAYSVLLQNMTAAWMSDNTDEAIRLNTYLEGMRAEANTDRLTIPLAVWITRDGLISKIQFPPFLHEQANADMIAVLQNRELPEPPPAEMVQPVRFNLILMANPHPAK
jgi:hypothetical protein